MSAIEWRHGSKFAWCSVHGTNTKSDADNVNAFAIKFILSVVLRVNINSLLLNPANSATTALACSYFSVASCPNLCGLLCMFALKYQ